MAETSESKKEVQEKAYIMTEESILSFLRAEEENGASIDSLRQRKRFVTDLYDWLPEEKHITKEVLRTWRKSLEDNGYAPITVLNYIKGVNRYLKHIGRFDLRFNRGRAKDLTGRQFGYLTALEPTGEKHRKDFVWHCICKCGREIELPATRLLTGHTISCGCLLAEHLQNANKYFAGTSLRQALEERVQSTRAKSGFTGITERNGKWRAQINYKGQHYYLGSYSKLENAVKARARAKELVQEDARALLESYNELREHDQPLPSGKDIVKYNPPKENIEKAAVAVLRSDNTSGCAGVTRHRKRWVAKITYQKVTYQLGSFPDQESAIRARKAAEQELKSDPERFVEEHSRTQN